MISILATLAVAFATHTVHHKKHHPAPVTLTGDPWTTSDVWYNDHSTRGPSRGPEQISGSTVSGRFFTSEHRCGLFVYNEASGRCEYTIKFSLYQRQNPITCETLQEGLDLGDFGTTMLCSFYPDEPERAEDESITHYMVTGHEAGEDEHVESFRTFWPFAPTTVDNCLVFVDFSSHTTLSTCTPMQYAEPMMFTKDPLEYFRYGHGDYTTYAAYPKTRFPGEN